MAEMLDAMEAVLGSADLIARILKPLSLRDRCAMKCLLHRG